MHIRGVNYSNRSDDFCQRRQRGVVDANRWEIDDPQDPSGAAEVVDLAAGRRHLAVVTGALHRGQLLTWGDNEAGQVRRALAALAAAVARCRCSRCSRCCW